MSGRIIPIILGKGQKFPEIESPFSFWSFMVSLRTVMALVGVSFIIFVCAGSPLLQAVFF